ncbi:MAG: type II secretion system protein GspC [Myxococcaceae bacterium]
MELLFRKYFWTINLLFIALVGWIVARTANIFVEAKVAPVTTAQPVRAAQKPRAEPVTQLQMEQLAKLTGLPVPVPEPEVKEPEQAVADLNADPVKSGLRVKLLGTLLASQQEWSIASIQDTVTNVSTTYMVGDKVQNAEIIEIERKRVIVINNGRKEYIDDQAGSGEAIAAIPAMPAAQVAKAPAGPKSNLGEGIRAVNENEYEVPRNEIDKTLSNLNDIAMQARIVPSFKDGVAQGFKLFSIRPDSIYSKIGVQNGDVIKRINGFDLNSPEKALEVYSKLKEANRVDLELERNGSTIRKTYNIR